MLPPFKDIYWKMTKTHYKKDSYNSILQIFSENNNNNPTIQASCVPRIFDCIVLKPFPDGNYEWLYVCDKYIITFVTRKDIIGFWNTAHFDPRDRYPVKTKNNAIKVTKDKLLVLIIMNFFSSINMFFMFNFLLRSSNSMCLPIYWWWY